MSLTGKAINYLQSLYPNASFLRDIKLHDVGNGPEIYYWGVGTPQPTEEELNVAAESMVPKPPMPSDHDLIMMVYNDKKNNTDTFVKAIDAANGIK